MIDGIEYKKIQQDEGALNVAIDHLLNEGFLRIKSAMAPEVLDRVLKAAEQIER